MKKIVIGVILGFVICFVVAVLNILLQTQKIEVLEGMDMPMSTLSTNGYSVFAVDKSGRLWGWGENPHNVLQIKGSEALYPKKIFNLVKNVSVGGGFVLAVRKDDTLWGWGLNHCGQLGCGNDTDEENKPIKIMDNVSIVSASSSFSVVLKNDGSLWASGSNVFGVLGNEIPTTGSYNYSNRFIRVMDDIRSFHADWVITAVDKDNCLWVWGKNRIENWEVLFGETYSYGLINDDDEQETVSNPKKLMDNVRYACWSGEFLYILKLDGELIEWKTPKSQRTIMNDAKYVDAVGETLAVITNDNTLICWGLPVAGIDDIGQKIIAENVTYVAVSREFLSYIDKRGNLYCAGLNHHGIVGNGENTLPEYTLAPDEVYPFIRSAYVFPPYKTLTNVACPEIPPTSGVIGQ